MAPTYAITLWLPTSFVKTLWVGKLASGGGGDSGELKPIVEF